MRGLRSTIALLVILIGLGAYIYFVTSKQPDTTEPPRERVFAGLESDAIDEVTVKSDMGETTALKKIDGTWQITAPASFKADPSEVASLTSNLASLEVARVVDEAPADVTDYGLEPPLVEVTFKASGDKTYGEAHRLFLGSKSPTGGDVFARRDADQRVVLVPGYLEPIFNRSTFNLRDKTLVAFDRDKIDRITVASAGNALAFAKDGTDWKITSPIAAAADSTAVDAIMGRLTTTQMKTIVTEQATAADLTKYGFGRPQATTTLTGGGTTASVVVGGNASDAEVYARDPSKPIIATVESALLKDFQKGVDEYRRKEIFALRGFSTDRIEFTRGGQTTVIERVKTEGQPDKWRRLSPTAGDLDTMSVDDLLSRLGSLRAAAFVDAAARTGLDQPTLTVYARFEDGKKEERVAFAKTDTEVYAAVPGQPGAVTVAATAFDEVVTALDKVSK
jgi:hypothetical protein